MIISPQKWGNMVLSKQHYALELAKRNNDVYFLNPATQTHISLYPNPSIISNKAYNVNEVNYNIGWFSQVAKHKLRLFYNLWTSYLIMRLLRKLNKKIDLVWCFDPMSFSNLKLFKADQIIYHPVDIHTTKFHQSLAKQADVVLSVAQLILDNLGTNNVNMFHVHHGLADEFVDLPSEGTQENGEIHCSYVGNLLRQDIDRATIKNLIETYPHVNFHFIGNYGQTSSNLDTDSLRALEFVDYLKQCKNVRLLGVMSTNELAQFLQTMDIHLICYDPVLDMCKGTNYHKVIEYLSTGKAIVSNHVTTYKDMHLMYMCDSTANNHDFLDKFQYCISNLGTVNSTEMQNRRRKFALGNTYSLQVDKIEKILTSLNSNG